MPNSLFFCDSNLWLYRFANILYSEDMQDGLIISQQLTIINPFKPEKPGF